MRIPHLLRPLAILGTCLACCSCASSDGVSIQGAGATFPAPLYKRWFLEYYQRHPDVRVNYQAIGSSAGIRQFTEGTVLFGASDAAMSPKEVDRVEARHGVGVQLLPMTAGSVILCYNLPGGPNELRLSRKAYLGIFLGKVTRWNDPAIAAANPRARLPATLITVIRRAEGSGTTYAFTNHLNAVANRLGRKWTPGVGKSIVWPSKDMIGARGNPGVAALIQQTPGAIGYLEYGYAELAELPMAVLENRSGAYVKATPASSQAALKGVRLPRDYRIWIPDPHGKDAYPIVTYTWLLCYSKYQGKQRRAAQELKKVIRFCLTDGQKYSKELGYIPLPRDVANEVLKAVDNIQIEGQESGVRSQESENQATDS
jgi:phosphate transport system substrate-binding protein